MVSYCLWSIEHDIAATCTLPLEVVPEPDNAKIQLCNRWFYMQEDPFRIRFPSYDFDDETPTRNLAEVKQEQELAASIYRARLSPGNRLCVNKEVD